MLSCCFGEGKRALPRAGHCSGHYGSATGLRYTEASHVADAKDVSWSPHVTSKPSNNGQGGFLDAIISIPKRAMTSFSCCCLVARVYNKFMGLANLDMVQASKAL